LEYKSILCVRVKKRVQYKAHLYNMYLIACYEIKVKMHNYNKTRFIAVDQI